MIDDSSTDPGLIKPFLEHLEDLRGTLIRAAIAIVVGMVIAFPLTPWILGVLKVPLDAMGTDTAFMLQSMEVAGAFVAAMRMAFWCGVLFSAPALVIIFGMFVIPALKPPEKKLAIQACVVGTFLFIFGVFFGYKYTLPFALQAMHAMHGWLGVSPLWTINSYVAFSSQLLIAFGIAFEIPMLLLILGKFGIVSGNWLAEHRRHAVVVTLIIACILTPPDIVSQIIMTIPLVLMYEGCVWIVRAWDRKRNAAGSAVESRATGRYADRKDRSGDEP